MLLRAGTSRSAALLALPMAVALVHAARATVIAPQGSLTLSLENYGSGPPYYSQPYFVYSSNGGSAPVFDSNTNTWSGGVSGQLTAANAAPNGVTPADTTVTITGQRYVYQVGTNNGINNLGISVSDLQTLRSSGVYPDGTYSRPANLVATIDGLQLQFTSVNATYFVAGSAAFQNDDFTGTMLAGTNSVTGQSYSQGIANLDLSLNQSNVAGNSTIGYTVTLNVQPAPVPEPGPTTVLGMGLVALGMVRLRW